MFKMVVHEAITGLDGVNAFVNNTRFRIEKIYVSCL